MVNSFFIQNAGFFYFKGKDRIDFLNRISTNDFRSFKTNEFVKTLLTSEKGKIIDLITVFEYSSHSVIKTTNENKDSVENFINKYIFSEDVKIENPGITYYLITLTGDNIIDFVNKEFNVPKPEDNRYFTLYENSILYFDLYDIPFVRIIAGTKDLDDILPALNELHKMDKDEFEYFCIQNVIPESEDELNGNINPLECNLDKYISFTKGCFVGQEVIARLDSQQKLPKRMVRFESEMEIKRNDKIYYREANFNLYECGFISKVVKRNEKYLGFAFIRNIYLNYEMDYFTKDNDLVKIQRINSEKVK